MQRILILIGALGLISSVQADTVKLVYDGIVPSSLEGCKAIGITPEDVSQIVFIIDNSKMRTPSQGFPEIIKTEKLEGYFRIRDFLGIDKFCGGYQSRVHAKLNGRPYDVKWMSITTPYVDQVCTKDFSAVIHMDQNKFSPGHQVCVIKLKSVNY